MSGLIVFRGSRSDPESKFSEGFKAGHKSGKGEGVQIQIGGQMIGGVSLTKELEIAVRYAANYGAASDGKTSNVGGWVYVVYVTDGKDVVEFMQKKSQALFGGGDKWKDGIENARTQAEIAAPMVRASQVIAARQAHVVESMAELFGKVRLNWTIATSGSVPAAVAMDAIRTLSSEVSVSINY